MYTGVFDTYISMSMLIRRLMEILDIRITIITLVVHETT